MRENLLGPQGEGQSILVVDDTTSTRKLYSILLSRSGYVVRSAATGEEALSLIAKLRPDLVLLDYMMPGLNGADVLRSLRRSSATRDMPVVILTASVAGDDIETALASGADDYINKPVDSRILLKRIRSIIRAHADRKMAAARPERDKLKRELAEARQVQQAQLPRVPTRWQGWNFTGSVVPSGEVAGDVFDIVETEDKRGICLLIDVSGHGTASALVAAETRTSLRDLVRNRGIQQAITILSQRMVERDTGMYACVAAVEIAGEVATVVNAGLPPVVLLRDGQVVESVVASGLPIGMFAEAEYESINLQTRPGDTIAMVSDGLTEPFGPPDDVTGALARMGFTEVMDAQPPSSVSPDKLCERVTRVARDLSPEQRDDATVVIMDRFT